MYMADSKPMSKQARPLKASRVEWLKCNWAICNCKQYKKQDLYIKST